MTPRKRQQRFEALLREHQRIVYKVAGVYAHAGADREDLVQEIAERLWRSFDSFDARRAKFTTWMYRVALNVAISHLRSAKRYAAEHLEPLDDVHLDTVADSIAAQPDAMDREERVTALHAFIRRLDALNRALVLLYLEDRSYAEIAEVLGISETNVATKLNRIKQKPRGQVGAAQTEGVGYGTR
ncbi:MAG: sigma-70 family RNA polymerase sigma factor [Rhodanobacteraceae bacterium]|nr:MAG: sigma-70 family RNA polymerase sigma factor [Rhodanobacteraceae bacterium]